MTLKDRVFMHTGLQTPGQEGGDSTSRLEVMCGPHLGNSDDIPVSTVVSFAYIFLFLFMRCWGLYPRPLKCQAMFYH